MAGGRPGNVAVEALDYGAGHALCAAHPSRDLVARKEITRLAGWAEQLRQVLFDAKPPRTPTP